MPQVIQPLELALLKMDLVQSGVALFLQHSQTLRTGVFPLQQAHIGLHLLRSKTDVVEGHNGAQPFQIGVIVLPVAHHLFDRPAQSPALVLPQDVHGDLISLTCLLYGHMPPPR